jgi:hypothetical protein
MTISSSADRIQPLSRDVPASRLDSGAVGPGRWTLTKLGLHRADPLGGVKLRYSRSGYFSRLTMWVPHTLSPTMDRRPPGQALSCSLSWAERDVEHHHASVERHSESIIQA